MSRLAPILLGLLAGCWQNGQPLSVDRVTPAAAPHRAPARVTLEGTGFDGDVKVTWGDAAAKVVSVSPETLVVELPAVPAPRRAPLKLVRRGADALSPEPFVGYLQLPDDWHFGPGSALPVPADLVAAADLDADGMPEFVVSGARGAGVVHAGESPSATWLDTGAPALQSLDAVQLGGRAAVLGRTAEGYALFAVGADGGVGRTAWTDAGTGLLVGAGHVVHALDGGLVVSELAGTPDAPALVPLAALGRFEPASVDAADADGDGDLDLLLGGAREGPRLLLADGAGNHRDAPVGTIPSSVAGPARFADLDADGQLDVVVATAGGDVALRRVEGRYLDRTLPLLGRTGARARFEVDLDGDAAVDRVGGEGLGLWRNDGTGSFYDFTLSVARPWAGATPLLALDADRDGDVDLLVREGSGVVRLLRGLAGEAWVDGDGDGVHDGADNCPSAPNPDQAEQDAHPFSCVGYFCSGEPQCRLERLGERAVLACSNAVKHGEAAAACRARGARLVLPRDETEAKALGKLLGATWIDVSDTAEEGSFVTSGGVAPPYAPWGSGEPNDSGGNQDCGVNREAGDWDDLACDQARPYACEETGVRRGDGRGDACDVCPEVPDASQADADTDGVGDACEEAGP